MTLGLNQIKIWKTVSKQFIRTITPNTKESKLIRWIMMHNKSDKVAVFAWLACHWIPNCRTKGERAIVFRITTIQLSNRTWCKIRLKCSMVRHHISTQKRSHAWKRGNNKLVSFRWSMYFVNQIKRIISMCRNNCWICQVIRNGVKFLYATIKLKSAPSTLMNPPTANKRKSIFTMNHNNYRMIQIE